MGFDDNYETYNTPLPAMYQSLLTSGKPNSEIERLLNENFLVQRFPEIYEYIRIPFWYKIYTVNIDNLLEKLFDSDELQILKYPRDEYKERDQTLEKLQIIYLHGKLMCKPNEVIFSRNQYAYSTLKLQPLYFQFVQEYSTLPTVFIGTALDEPIFDQYIAARQERRSNIRENRPKSFLIDPYINPVQENILRNTYNIEPIKATTEDFLNWLDSIGSELPDKFETLKIVLPSLNQLLSLPGFKDSFRDNISDFAQSFSKVNISRTFTKESKAFLLGTSPTWADIYLNLDAPRVITSQVYEYVEECFDESNISIVSVLGTAGSGKSTLLKRLSYALAKNGRSVYFSFSETIPDIENLYRTLEMLKEKVVLAFDNAELILNQLAPILDQLKNLSNPPVIILAARTNLYDKISSRYENLSEAREFIMPNLVREEIIEIIKILAENNMLGYLKGLGELQRIKEFENRAKKQILVAMREATNGKDFDEIIKSEFFQIEPLEARILCVCVALTTDAGFIISRQEFVSFSSADPATTLDYLERTLKDIILKAGPKADKLLLRHRVIAEYIIDNCITGDILKQAYIKVLSSLANQINSSNRNPRRFLLYREIINHFTVYRRFSKDIQQARDVYESLSTYFNDDFQFWLQYGALESEGRGGNLQLAENYLNQAFSLRPDNLYIKNALANLYYKKSLEASSVTEAASMKEEADRILIENLSDRRHNDPYTYNIYAKGYYEYSLKWAVGKRDLLKEYFSEIQKIIKQGLSLYPHDKKLQDINQTIVKAIMMTNVENDDIQYPILFKEVEDE